MATKNELLQFTITNNTTDCNINVPFLSQDSPIINARKKYTWNITGLNLGCGCWSIVINNQVYQAFFNGTLIGLIAAFNNLGFSFFCSTTSGGNLLLYTLDDYNVYGDIENCFCTPTTTTTSTTTTTTTPTPTTSTTTTTTTPTPTTSTTTTTTTPTPTTSTTTTTTTPTPTTTTSTTTTTTTLPPGFKVGTSFVTLCAGGGSSITTITYVGGTTICNALSISATSFNSLAAGNYIIFEPSLGWVDYNKPGGVGTSTMNRTGGGCTAC